MPASMIELADGHRHVVDDGAGDPALVLIHSFPLDGRMWKPQLGWFSPDRRVIVPDLRGAGRSDAPEDPSTYSVDGWASDVMAMLTQLQVERPVLVGAGSGADVALALVRLFPGLPCALVLAGPWPDVALPEESRAQTQQQSWPQAGGDTESIADLVLPAMADDTPARAEVAELARLSFANAPMAGLIGGLEALRQRGKVRGDLAKLDIPMLLVRGEIDPLTTSAALSRLRDAMPRAGLAEIDRCGHLVNLEAPAAFNRLVQRFLDDTETSW